MRPQDRILARWLLDRKLTSLRNTQGLARPASGWIRAIRDALGMTGRQLGVRLGVSQPRVTTMEKAEIDGSITLNSLQRAAQAMDCELVYAFVPRRSLAELVEERAGLRARSILQATGHGVPHGDQRQDADVHQIPLDRLTRELTDSAGRRLWEDE